MEKTLERIEHKVDEKPAKTEVRELAQRVRVVEASLGHFTNPDAVRKFLEEWEDVRGQIRVIKALGAYRRWLWVAGLGALGLLATLGFDTWHVVRGGP